MRVLSLLRLVAFFKFATLGCVFKNCTKFNQQKLHDLQNCHFYLDTLAHHCHNHNHLPQPQHTQPQPHSPPPPMPPTPKAKAKHWGKVDKKYLSNLIREGDVNISNTSYVNIKDVRLKYFPHCKVKNFHHNFWDFAASLDLETKYTGARRREAGES